MKIWQLDPANLTPYYDMALADALAQAGANVRFISSHYLYEKLDYPKSYQVDEHYFRGLNHTLLRKNTSLRQLLRGFSYPFGHWWLVQLAKEDGFSNRANIVVDEGGRIVLIREYDIPQLPDCDEIIAFLGK